MNSVSIIFFIIGVAFDLFGCIGLLRLPDVYNRLQSATKSVTLGTCSILFGLFLHYGFTDMGIKSLIAIPLLFFASTVAAHALIRGSYKFGIKMWEGTEVDDYKEVSPTKEAEEEGEK